MAGDVPPGFAATATADVIERLGCRAVARTLDPDEPLVTTVGGADVDLVVLLVDGAPSGRPAHYAAGPWGRPARLTTGYVDKGVPVLAVGVGRRGRCRRRLRAPRRPGPPRSRPAARGVAVARESSRSRTPGRSPSSAIPGPSGPLLGLTAGERRVLFYLSEGWTAHDIAAELVVVARHRPLPHPLRPAQARGALAAGGGGRGQRPRLTARPSGPGRVSRPPGRRDPGGGQSLQQLVLGLEPGPQTLRLGVGQRGATGRSPGPGGGERELQPGAERCHAVGEGLGGEHGRARRHPVDRLGHVEGRREGVELAEQVAVGEPVEEGVEPVGAIRRSRLSTRPGVSGVSPATR